MALVKREAKKKADRKQQWETKGLRQRAHRWKPKERVRTDLRCHKPALGRRAVASFALTQSFRSHPSDSVSRPLASDRKRRAMAPRALPERLPAQRSASM